MDLKILSPFDKTIPKQLVFNAPRAWGIRTVAPKSPIAESAALTDAGFTPTPNDDYGWDPLKIVVQEFRKYGTDATPKQIHDYIVGLRVIFRGSAGRMILGPGTNMGWVTIPLLSWRTIRCDMSLCR